MLNDINYDSDGSHLTSSGIEFQTEEEAKEKKKSLILKCYFSEELIALIVLRWIMTRYIRITKPER